MKYRIPQSPSRGSGPLSNKRAFEMQFHWIFILIAGALILAFFFSIANKQREISQERLELTLATDIEDIFTGAIVSRGTAQKLPSPPQGITFQCSEGCDCNFKIERASKSFGTKSMFANELLTGRDITVWALELKMPYRVTNFLYLTNPNIKYYFVHDDSTQSKNLLDQITKNIPPLISYENATINEVGTIEEEGYQHTKLIFLNTGPTDLHNSFRKESASAIKINTQPEPMVYFYEKDNTRFEPTGGPLSFSGLPTIYAAIFSNDRTMYECGLKTAFKKFAYTSQLYKERAEELEKQAQQTGKEWCVYAAITTILNSQHQNAKTLQTKLEPNILRQLNGLSEDASSKNRNLVQQSCPEVF